MRRLCERPGCGGVAAVSYGIDNEKLLVWIDSAPALDPARAGSLCRRHADALSVPKGWSIDDRRQPIPMLFPARDVTPVAGHNRQVERKSPRTTSVKPVDVNEDVSLFDAEVTLPEDVGEVAVEEVNEQVVQEVDQDVDDVVLTEDKELEETRAIPWTPRLVATDENDDTASIPKGRLLGRAFGEHRPRRDA
jgi:hypothetical protein